MTLIASHAFGNGLRPFFVSDILLSAETSILHALFLPTVGDVSAIPPGHPKYRFVGLGQKVAILNENLVAAGSGFQIYYRAFAKYLAAWYAETPPTSGSDFVNLFDNYFKNDETRQSLGNMSGFVRYAAAHGGVSTYFDCSPGETIRHPYNCESEYYGQVLAYGTGGSKYIDIIKSMQSFEGAISAANPSYEDISFVFLAVGRLLAMEVTERHGYLHDYWGGGFEITAFVDGRFDKIGDILYLFSDVDVGRSAEEVKCTPHRLIKIKYVAEHLFFRCVEFIMSEDAMFNITDDRIIYVPPMIQNTPTPEDVAVPIDDNQWLCYAAYFVGPTGQEDSFVTVIPRYGLPAQRLPYSVREYGVGRIEIILSQQFKEQLAVGVWGAPAMRTPRAAVSIWPYPGAA